ncbi:hypothetical protein [Catellatospora methionotrophica]|uniref:hypothetical protein n=1 Tax=Catellatospora methionotrophica TaxID=121620 RepID=UPI00140C9769|nr:hypothetical protein [Catellatospora methionotrophica]
MRRLTAAAGIAVALLALTACRSNPSVAAYVGDQSFTEDKVTTLTEQAAKVQETAQPGDDAAIRTHVVQLLIYNTLCKRIAAEKGVKLPAAEARPSEYETLSQETQACVQALPLDQMKPSDEDLRKVYDNGVKAGVLDGKQPFEQTKAELAGNPQVAGAIAVYRVLTEAAKAADVTVNPRYRPLDLPVLTAGERGPVLSAPFGIQDSAVSDSVQEPAVSSS